MNDFLPLRKRGSGQVGFIDREGRWHVEPRFDFAAVRDRPMKERIVACDAFIVRRRLDVL